MGWRLGLACLLLAGCASTTEDAPRSELAMSNAAYELDVTPSVAASIDEAFVRREIEAAITRYAREVAPLHEPVSVVIDPPDCLRTGYDMPTRKVFFCKNDNTPRAGTASADVIHHEVFHAMLCQTKPGWCGSDAPVPLHEGLADYFAYVLSPDDLFGEGFYEDQAFVRRYRVPYCYSLVSGGHEKGNAIASALIARGHDLRDVAELVKGDALTVDALLGPTTDACFGADPPAVSRSVEGYPESTLERYRIRPDAPLTIRFAGNDAFARRYPNLTVRWDRAPTLFAVSNLDDRSFRIDVTGTDGFEKMAALYVVDGEVVGGKSFYFQVAR
jgi:hypothetical protein